MEKLRVSASRLHSIVAVLSLILACAVVLVCSTFMITLASGQSSAVKENGERLVRIETKAEGLAEADRRLADDVALLRGEVNKVKDSLNLMETTIASWKFAVAAVGALIGILQAVLLLTKGRLSYEPATERHKRSSGSNGGD